MIQYVNFGKNWPKSFSGRAKICDFMVPVNNSLCVACPSWPVTHNCVLITYMYRIATIKYLWFAKFPRKSDFLEKIANLHSKYFVDIRM